MQIILFYFKLSPKYKDYIYNFNKNNIFFKKDRLFKIILNKIFNNLFFYKAFNNIFNAIILITIINPIVQFKNFKNFIWVPF